jgi:formylglycine-generating enzyme required for sulfatase activity
MAFRVTPHPECGGRPIERVLRGGAWNNHPINARVAYRNNDHPENRNINNGFRCVVEAPIMLTA